MNSNALEHGNRTRVFRWYFYIALLQFLLYFIVPVVIFPSEMALDIEVISALTLGVAVNVFFLQVNVLGLYLDKSRRVLYSLMLSICIIYIAWVVFSWSFIERMDYLLR